MWWWVNFIHIFTVFNFSFRSKLFTQIFFFSNIFYHFLSAKNVKKTKILTKNVVKYDKHIRNTMAEKRRAAKEKRNTNPSMWQIIIFFALQCVLIAKKLPMNKMCNATKCSMCLEIVILCVNIKSHPCFVWKLKASEKHKWRNRHTPYVRCCVYRYTGVYTRM